MFYREFATSNCLVHRWSNFNHQMISLCVEMTGQFVVKLRKGRGRRVLLETTDFEHVIYPILFKW
jgi:hypothetical protein